MIDVTNFGSKQIIWMTTYSSDGLCEKPPFEMTKGKGDVINTCVTPSWKKFWFFGMSLACPYARVLVLTLYDQELKSVKS